jgi:glycosyltransferase involved in cell wall biosynthesis
MKRLRVLQIVNGLALNTKMGGAERFGFELARHLDKQTIEPIVVGLWEWEPTTEQKWRNQLEREGIVSIVGAPKDDRRALANFMESMRLIRQQLAPPVDIIHSQCDFGDVAALWLSRSLHPKATLRTAHNEFEWAKRPLRRWLLVKTIYPLAFDIEFGVSQRAVEILDQRPVARLLRKRAVVMHNAIDTTRFVKLTQDEIAQKRQSLGIAAGVPIVGSVGRLARQKGYHHFIEAAAILACTVADVRFLLVGGGEEEYSLRALVQKLDLTDRFIFAGARDDAPQLLQIMNVFVSSSLWEGLPTVILEAMLASVPVVATAVAGTTELVEDGATGILTTPADPTGLSNAVAAVLQQPESARSMVQRARQFVLANFDIRVVARQQEVFYQQLAADDA